MTDIPSLDSVWKLISKHFTFHCQYFQPPRPKSVFINVVSHLISSIRLCGNVPCINISEMSSLLVSGHVAKIQLPWCYQEPMVGTVSYLTSPRWIFTPSKQKNIGAEMLCYLLMLRWTKYNFSCEFDIFCGPSGAQSFRSVLFSEGEIWNF